MAASDSSTERQLLERLQIATQVAGIFVWELDWGTNRISWDANQPKVASGNHHFGQELGNALFEWVHPEDRGIGHEAMRTALMQGRTDASFRYRLLLADQSVRHIQAYARTTTCDDGQPLRSLGVSWDITSEVQATARLQSIAEHERKLSEHLSLATAAVGMQCWEFEYATDTFTWFHELPDEMGTAGLSTRQTGEVLMAAILPEDAEAVRRETEQALAAGATSMTTRMRRRASDGQVRHVQLYQRFTRDAEGRPVRAIGATRDITIEVEAAERFREQAELLHDAQRRLERASLSIHEGHWELDLLTLKHWASSSYSALLGYQPDELDLDCMDKVTRLSHPDDAPLAREALRNHIENDTPHDHEIRLRLKDGSYRWFRVRGKAERDADGRAIRLSGSIQDIQKQKLMEDELKTARLRLERAIRGTHDGMWEWDLALQTLWVSPRYEEILDYAEGEVSRTAKTPNALVHPDDLQTSQTAQQAHFERGAPYDVEVRMRARAGVYRWIRMRGEAERDAAGQPLRLAGSIQDVTQSRAARDALIQASEAAQAANRSKSAFLANMSHEIRTPMNAIIGMTSLLLESELHDEQRDCAETIQTSAQSLLAVINDILDFSKIEAGKLDVETIEMNLHDNVGEVLVMLAFQAAAKNLRLTVQVQPDMPHKVIGDPQRIRQCLINLISNAIKFTPSGEVVAEVSVAGRHDGRVLARFEVRDTGIGIAPEALPTLFQPFVQGDSSTTRHFGGTGLGLSIVRRLVEMMGGEVGVQSKLGKGSTFWFLLPLEVGDAARESSAAQVRREQADASRGRLLRRYAGRVLLVEDNPVNQKVARSFLERMGCEVTVAADGLAAVEAFAQSKYRLVLIDLQMPLMDGYSATDCMRKLEPGVERTPIVALTASAMIGQRERCLASGMDELLTKPLDIGRLQAVLDRFGLRIDSGDRGLDEAAVAQLVAAPSAVAAVDRERLRQVTGNDADFARDLARTFSLNSAELIAQLRESATRGDRTTLGRAAHTLKGACANIYAQPLHELCSELETRADALTEPDLTQHIARLVAERERVIRALHNLASAPAAAERLDAEPRASR
jgi:two-component system, sensor histidine kinase and response regulator